MARSRNTELLELLHMKTFGVRNDTARHATVEEKLLILQIVRRAAPYMRGRRHP
jgi:hypothetical protein